MRFDFKFIEPKLVSNSYPSLVGQPCGRKMKANISLDKDRLKIKGKGKMIIIPLNLMDGRWREDPNDDDIEIQWLYHIMQSNDDTVEPNNYG